MKYEDNMAYFSSAVADEVDAGSALDENYELFIQTIANIRNGVEGGILTEEEGKEKEAEALLEYQERVANILEIDELEYDDEESSYSEGDFDVANFEAGNNFGQAVMELAAEEYEDPLDALVDIADEFGLTDEQVVGLIQGVYAPDAELAQAIGSFFETTSTDEDAFLGLMVLAEDAAETVLEEYDEEEYDSDADTEILPEDEDDEEYEDDEDELEASYKMAELEDRIANFEAASIIDTTLSEFEAEAERGYREGWLTPKVRKMLLGNFRSSSERLAKFSSTCAENEVGPDVQLYAIDYALKVLEAAGPVAKFGAYVEQEVDDVTISAERNAEQQARLNFQLMKERK